MDFKSRMDFVKLWLTWVFLPSAVVSSNFSPRLHENCVVFRVLSVFMVRFLPSEEMIQSGLAIAPTFRRAMPTPVECYPMLNNRKTKSMVYITNRVKFNCSCYVLHIFTYSLLNNKCKHKPSAYHVPELNMYWLIGSLATTVWEVALSPFYKRKEWGTEVTYRSSFS